MQLQKNRTTVEPRWTHNPVSLIHQGRGNVGQGMKEEHPLGNRPQPSLLAKLLLMCVRSGSASYDLPASLIFLFFCFAFPDSPCGRTRMAFIFISDLDLVKECQPTLQAT